MGKRYVCLFGISEQDDRLRRSMVSALSSGVLSARFWHREVYDDSVGKWMIEWGHKPEGDSDAQ